MSKMQHTEQRTAVVEFDGAGEPKILRNFIRERDAQDLTRALRERGRRVVCVEATLTVELDPVTPCQPEQQRPLELCSDPRTGEPCWKQPGATTSAPPLEQFSDQATGQPLFRQKREPKTPAPPPTSLPTAPRVLNGQPRAY